MSLSKPRVPLGHQLGPDGGIVLIDERPPPPECSVCLEPLKYNRFFDLKCSHHVCCSCLTRWLIEKVRAEGLACAFPCPLCRRSLRVSALLRNPTPPIEGIGLVEECVLHCVEDAFDNWFCVVVETRDGAFVPADVGSTMRAYRRSQLCWMNPYSGWFSPKGSPRHNPCFEVL